MIKRAPRQPRHRTRLPNSYQPAAPALTWVATLVATKARLTLNLPYANSGVPTLITNEGVGATAIEQVAANVFDLTFPTAVVATDVLVVPANVPEVRGAAGGTLSAGTHTF